ncbi:hypothetical protein QN277_021035 [Acacia crassicarpa]|uniref:Uncharacterized protein n=1 Tax=Acacia crassicarpa TaxID=499986 RepID=A0AAE1JL16_9FABA|nr:hypothetical protein QN277_021035 [Acacia crassicarpa]
MKSYEAEQNVLTPLGKMRGYETLSDDKEHVICPKPRRASVLSQMFVRPFRYHLSQQGEGYDSKGGADILDIIFEESYGEEPRNLDASLPPYFVGSPPVRSGNPLIQDSQFVYEKKASAFLSSSSSASSDFFVSTQRRIC